MEIGKFEEYRGYKYGSIECEEGRMFGSVYVGGKRLEYEVKGPNNSCNLIKLHEEFKKAIDERIEELIAIEMAKPQLKIKINWSLYTDGDYHIDNYEKYGCKDHEDGSEYYVGEITFVMSEDKGCRREAISILEQMLCDIRVGYNHYWLIKDMYDMFEKAMRFVSKKDNYGEESVFMGGNYDVTEIRIRITRAENEEETKCEQ